MITTYTKCRSMIWITINSIMIIITITYFCTLEIISICKWEDKTIICRLITITWIPKKRVIPSNYFFWIWNFCLRESKFLFNSDKFINLEAPLLELLLKRDDLNVDEIEIWESLLKWCFTQHNVNNDPANWSKDDITN